MIHPLKIFSSLNPVNPGVKEQSSTGKIRDFKGKKLLLLEKNGLAEGSSRIFYEMPISPSATAAECPVCACIIHHWMYALFRAAPHATAASQAPDFGAHSLSLLPFNAVPGSQRGERPDLNEHRAISGARASGVGVLLGPAAGCCDSKGLFPWHSCSWLEHSKIGDVALGAVWWMKTSINDAPARLAFMNCLPLEAWKAQNLALKYLVCVVCSGFALFASLMCRLWSRHVSRKASTGDGPHKGIRGITEYSELGRTRRDPQVTFGAEKMSFGVLINWFVTCFSF